MSITSLTSPPEKTSRRVRFSLPEAKLTFSHGDKRTLHGTSKYVNGTLINVTSTIHSTNELCKSAGSKTDINGGYKSNLKSNGNLPSKESSQYTVSLNIRPTTSIATVKEHGRNSLPTTTLSSTIGRRRASKTVAKNSEKSFNILPIIKRKSSSLEDFDEDSLDGDFRDRDESELKEKSSTNLTRYKSSDDLRDPNSFKVKNTVLKLPEAPNGAANLARKRSSTSNTLKVPHYSDTSKN